MEGRSGESEAAGRGWVGWVKICIRVLDAIVVVRSKLPSDLQLFILKFRPLTHCSLTQNESKFERHVVESEHIKHNFYKMLSSTKITEEIYSKSIIITGDRHCLHKSFSRYTRKARHGRWLS